MRKFVGLATLAALALGAQTASAEGFSYNLLEGSYSFADAGGVDGDGFGIQGSTELAPSVYTFSGLRSLSFDDADVDFDNLNLGVGLNYALSDNTDVFGGVSWERQSVDTGVGSGSDSGYGISGGVRGRIGDSLELSASVKYTDVDTLGDTFTYNAGVRWYFTPNFAVGADFDKFDVGLFDDFDGEAWTVSLRYDFGDR